jgi:hypothetical protein
MAIIKQPQENPEQFEAFMTYYQMGDERSFTKVAEKIGRSIKACEVWSKKFHWQKKIAQLDLQIVEQLRSKMVRDIVKQKMNYQKLVNNLIAKIIKEDTKELLIKPKSINDVVSLIKTSLLLAGETTEREELLTGSFVDLVKKIKANRSSEAEVDDGTEEGTTE